MWNGFANALSQAMELVTAPLLFALIGYFCDRYFGTAPVLAIVLGLVGLAGVVARSYYWYRAEIEREEEGKPWMRNRR